MPYAPETGASLVDALAAYEGQDITALVIPQPNFFGVLEDVDALTDWAHARGLLVIARRQSDLAGAARSRRASGARAAPTSRSATASRSACRCPPAARTSASSLRAGARAPDARPHRRPHRRSGRPPGLHADAAGARAAHPPLKATSNICTNQGLLVTAATIYMALLGPQGLARVAAASHASTRELVAALTRVNGVRPAFDGPCFHEAVLLLDRPVRAGAAGAGGARHTGRLRSGARTIPSSATRCWCARPRPRHRRHRSAMRARSRDAMKAARARLRRRECAQCAEKVIFEHSRPGRGATAQWPQACRSQPICPPVLRRNTPPLLPEVSELDAVRHYTRLSQNNFSIDTHFYPLGSCTMKYNPRRATRSRCCRSSWRAIRSRRRSHGQGFLACMYELQEMLKEVTGMAGVSLAPMAGAQGEFAGVAMIRAYHDARGDQARTEILVPDAAHGTNPATATMCGYTVREIPDRRRRQRRHRGAARPRSGRRPPASC